MLKAGMRVIAGQFRSRLLAAPRGSSTRPTSDRLRETLFNVLGPRVQGARFADLYAGSGAVAIEALSRGAAYCLLVEAAPPAVAAIRKNFADLKLNAGWTLDTHKVQRALETPRGEPFALIFLDPPYEAALEYEATLQLLAREAERLLTASGLVIAEHARRTPLQPCYGTLVRTRVLEQGDAALSFYTPQAASAAEGSAEA